MDRITRLKLAKRRAETIGKRGIKSLGLGDFTSSRGIGSTNYIQEEKLDLAISNFDDKTVFVHAGLSDINSAFAGNPYDVLMRKLDGHFDSILAPGFTPSFRNSGVYHKKFSKPEYGKFSELLFNDIDYRTDDAIHSILVKGNYRFEDCDHDNSFSESSCFAKLDKDNVLYLTIGTKDFRSSQLHYIEHLHELPYVQTPEYRGVIYFDERKFSKTTQVNRGYNPSVRWNRPKIKQFLEKKKVLRDLSLGDLRIHSYRSKDVRKVLTAKLNRDPWFLVT